MLRLRDVLEQAQKNGVAVGHFNIGDFVILKAVFTAARELQVPVMVGVSEGEREFLGVRQIAALVRSLREEFDFPIFLNADHTHSLEKALEAAKQSNDPAKMRTAIDEAQKQLTEMKEHMTKCSNMMSMMEKMQGMGGMMKGESK